MAMSSHEAPNKGATDVWLTPHGIIRQLGPFDLDPCAATNPPWPTANEHYVESQDGLSLPWYGMVWLNPPYSDAWTWMERLAAHGQGIALVFARTETVGFHKTVWDRATAIAFPKGRLKFCTPDGQPAKGNAGAPSCYVAYGIEARDRLARMDDIALLTGWSTR